MGDGKQIGYKGFDRGMTCRGMQYEVGKTYTHDGPVELCRSGLHWCEYPLDVLTYYPLGSSEYALVEASGTSDEKGDDTKRVSASLTVMARLDIAGLVKAAVEWTTARVGDSVAKGDYSSAASSGDSSSAASSGNSSSAASSGYSSRAASSGNSSSAASSGDSSRAASSGNSSSAASSGYSSSAASSGDYSSAASSGNSSSAAASGEQTIAMVCGVNGLAMAGPNGAIALAWHDGKRPRIAVGYIGEGGIEADKWYRVNEHGQLVEAA